MRSPIRLFALVLLSIALVVPVMARAQVEPTAIIDAALQDLTNKLGTPINRVTANWTWEEQNFPDSSLGCPQPDVAYTQVVTKGYIIKIETRDFVGQYDYRATLDGSVLILCSANPPIDPNLVGTPPPTNTPGAATAPAPQPVTLGAPVLAYLAADGNVTLTSLSGGSAPVALTVDANRRYANNGLYPEDDHGYGNLQWSPDGTRLLFNDLRNNVAYVATSGQAPQVIAMGLAGQIPVAFSPDGTEILFAVPTTQSDPNTNELVLQLQAVTAPGVAPRQVGSIKFGVGCGGGGYPPSMVQYFVDAGYSGNNMTLRWTPQGILHSTNCLGGGLRLVDLSGNTVWDQPNLKRAAVSPDGTRVVAINDGNLSDDPSLPGDSIVMIDLASGNTTTLFTGEVNTIERVGWSADGSQVLYNTKRTARTAVGNTSVQIGSQVFIDWPHTATTYTLEVFSIAPTANSTPKSLTTFEGYGIGNIVSAPNSVRSAISVISSDVQVIEKLNAGGTIADLASLRSKVSIYAVGTDGSTSLSVGEGAQPAFSTSLQFVAVPAASPQLSAPLSPPALVVGGQAVVNVQDGDAINVRENPSTSATVVKTLARGAVVTITGSAVEAEGLRWWPIRVEPTGEVGWAVDQVTENGVTEFTLVPQ